MQLEGLSPKTAVIFDKVSKLDCIKPYTLVGGTALSLQIGTRQSEDLDFMSWRKVKSDSCEVPWNLIVNELETIGTVQDINLMDFDHVEFLVDNVKISFYACDKHTPIDHTIDCLNNIKLADIPSIGAMKLEVMLRRAAFRDYYDIYSILKTGVDINLIIEKALKYSRHRLKSKNIYAILTDGERFRRDENFAQLRPIYQVSSLDIEHYIRDIMKAKVL